MYRPQFLRHLVSSTSAIRQRGRAHSNAFLERWAEFLRLAWMARHGKTLFLPEMSPHSGEYVAEGGAAFVAAFLDLG